MWHAFGNTIWLWNVDTGTHIKTLYGHRYTVYSLAFSPDGKTLVSGSADGTVLFWDLDNHSGF